MASPLLSSSKLEIIDDTNFRSYANIVESVARPEMGGYEPRDFSAEPYGSVVPASTTKLIPENQWKERIEELDAKEGQIYHLKTYKNIPVKNQLRTNYCWVFGTVSACEYVRVKSNLDFVSLSPASVGCLVKNFANVGGWGMQALRKMIEVGISPSEFWSDAAIDRRYHNKESNQARKDFVPTEWFDVIDFDDSDGWPKIVTQMILGRPTTVAFNWWRHLVLAVGLVIDSAGRIGLVILNSWGPDWGEDGLSVIFGNKAVPNESVAPSVLLGSDGQPMRKSHEAIAP